MTTYTTIEKGVPHTRQIEPSQRAHHITACLSPCYPEVYFMVRKYNVGARDYYQEFLFDEGKLIFYFEKSGTSETRYYWGPDGLAKEDIKGERLSDEVMASRLSYELLNAFNLLMNREF